VVHLSGSFHIDYGLGIVPRLKARRPSDKIVTVALRPVENFDEATLQKALEAEPGVADYVVFVLKEEPAAPQFKTAEPDTKSEAGKTRELINKQKDLRDAQRKLEE
jgi:hypothetical protein